MEFREFFKAACGHDPYPYQVQLAESEITPSSIHIPTGAGKTAAVVLSWLWRRRFTPTVVRNRTPRRLVYCLPMRVLVEQIGRDMVSWISNLESAYPERMRDHLAVHILMGGEPTQRWDTNPEADAIIVGTQDMLLSRAMNRGYGSSQFRWPMEFGLLNNDCHWMMDEVQLMSVGLSTSVQLASFRAKLGTYGPTHSTWMSATLETDWLRTVDHEPDSSPLRLLDEDRQSSPLSNIMDAEKTLIKGIPQLGETKAEEKEYCKSVASAVLEAHNSSSMTLVILNTVRRARRVHESILKMLKKSGHGNAEVYLIHSRFRPHERDKWLDSFLGRDATVSTAGTVIVSTQVVEAGVDVSARTVLTELAPWPSMVQRAGRCNRRGEFRDSKLIWFDISDSVSPPYDPLEIGISRRRLCDMDGSQVSPSALEKVKIDMPYRPTQLLRRRDLVELFDTTSDLSGGVVDVSRFIRESDDSEILVCWRNLNGQAPSTATGVSKNELCPVPVGEFRGFMKRGKKSTKGWLWDYLEGKWRRVRHEDMVPGRTIVLDSLSGGYSPDTGWSSESDDPVTDIHDPNTRLAEWTGADNGGYWQTVAEHSMRAEEIVKSILAKLDGIAILEDHGNAVVLSSRLHDIGKAHQVFQNTLLSQLSVDEFQNRKGKLWAKSQHGFNRHERPYFRHELASAIALVDRNDLPFDRYHEIGDLVCYLVASHHGKVRLSIRSLPGESEPEGGIRYARGIWDGDILPEVDLGDGIIIASTKLDLSLMDIGTPAGRPPSWLTRMLELRDSNDLGPFRLAYLEALVRAADWRASDESNRPEVNDHEAV